MLSLDNNNVKLKSPFSLGFLFGFNLIGSGKSSNFKFRRLILSGLKLNLLKNSISINLIFSRFISPSKGFLISIFSIINFYYYYKRIINYKFL